MNTTQLSKDFTFKTLRAAYGMQHTPGVDSNLWNLALSKISKISILATSGGSSPRLKSFNLDPQKWEAIVFNRSNYWNEYVQLVKTLIRLFQLIHSDHCEVV